MVKNIQKHEIVSPVANGIASDTHSRHISEQIEKHLKSVFETSQQVTEANKEPTLEEQAKKLGIGRNKAKGRLWVDPDEVSEELACVDIHGLLPGDAVMQESAESLFKYMLSQGIDKSEALAIIGNSLIEIHNNPYAYAQHAALPLVVGGLEACAINPTCANMVAMGLSATYTALKMDAAPKLDNTLKTPIPDYESKDEGFTEHRGTATLEGFDIYDEWYVEEGFTIPEKIDTSILTKLEFDKNGKILLDKFRLKDSEGGSHEWHSVERHVRKSDGYLIQRVVNEGKKAATTFPDYKTANEVVKEVLKHNNDDIVKWTESAKDRETLPITKVFDHSIGHGITKNGIKFDSNKVKVVLVKIGKEVEVLTSYPVK